MPVTPDKPGVPVTPDKLAAPVTPDKLAAPVTPDKLAAPATPDKLAAPVTPDKLAAPVPVKDAKPGTPKSLKSDLSTRLAGDMEWAAPGSVCSLSERLDPECVACKVLNKPLALKLESFLSEWRRSASN